MPDGERLMAAKEGVAMWPFRKAHDPQVLVEKLCPAYLALAADVMKLRGAFGSVHECGVYVASLVNAELRHRGHANGEALALAFSAAWVNYLAATPNLDGSFSAASELGHRLEERYLAYARLYRECVNAPIEAKFDLFSRLGWAILSQCSPRIEPDGRVVVEMESLGYLAVGFGILALKETRKWA